MSTPATTRDWTSPQLDQPVIRYRAENGIAVIELDDPPANTYTYAMMRQLDDAVLQARDELVPSQWQLYKGISADTIAAIYDLLYERTVDGRYTGELEFYCYGQAKADEIRAIAKRRKIDLAGSYAYTGVTSPRIGSTMAHAASTVGHPIAVNPDRDLRRQAEARGWKLRDFRRPVRLRTRIVRTATQPKTRVAAGVAAAVAAAAILGYLVIRSRTAAREAA